jgi:hypothetical protein
MKPQSATPPPGKSEPGEHDPLPTRGTVRHQPSGPSEFLPKRQAGLGPCAQRDEYSERCWLGPQAKLWGRGRASLRRRFPMNACRRLEQEKAPPRSPGCGRSLHCTAFQNSVPSRKSRLAFSKPLSRGHIASPRCCRVDRHGRAAQRVSLSLSGYEVAEVAPSLLRI